MAEQGSLQWAVEQASANKTPLFGVTEYEIRGGRLCRKFDQKPIERWEDYLTGWTLAEPENCTIHPDQDICDECFNDEIEAGRIAMTPENDGAPWLSESFREIEKRDTEIAKLKRHVDSLLALIRGVRNSADAALTMEGQ